MSVVTAENADEIVESGQGHVLSRFSARKLEMFIKSYITTAYLKKETSREVGVICKN